MNKTVNQKLDALRAKLEASTPSYTKTIKASGSVETIPTASVKKGKTPEYEKAVKASGTAKALPTPSQSKPAARGEGYRAEFRKLMQLAKLTDEA